MLLRSSTEILGTDSDICFAQAVNFFFLVQPTEITALQMGTGTTIQNHAAKVVAARLIP